MGSVSRGSSEDEQKNRISPRVVWGTAVIQMAYPSVAPKIIAVKKSRIDLANNMVWSPETDVPNDNLQLLDLYKKDIDDFYHRVIEKNA